MAKKEKKQEETTTNWTNGFVRYTLEHNRRPNSAYQLAQFLDAPEADFYDTYNSIEAVEKDLWTRFFIDTKEILLADEAYQTYGVRQKMLAFYFTWTGDFLKANRSYILWAFENGRKNLTSWKVLEGFRKELLEFLEDLISEGYETEEIKNREIISRAYPELVWGQTLFVLRYWIKDTSKGFEQTDAFIEKTVNLIFDLIGKNFLDSLFDWGKFTAQRKK
jgi:hypothetical protein